jgi:uncharacterized protein
VWLTSERRIALPYRCHQAYSPPVTDGHADTPREVVESAFAAWNQGDVAAFADHIAEDVVWVEVSGWLEAESSVRRGRDLVRESLQGLFDIWESYRLDVERVEIAGDRALAIVREVARGRSSGIEVDGRWGYLLTVEDGQIARVEAHRDPEDAIEEWAVQE